MPTVETTWKTIRTQLVAARLRTGLTQNAIVRRLRIHRSTVGNLESSTNTTIYSRMDTAIGYAHMVGLELVAVDPRQAHLLALDRGEIVALLRAAQAALDGHRLSPLQARKINEILAKVLPAATEGATP